MKRPIIQPILSWIAIAIGLIFLPAVIDTRDFGFLLVVFAIIFPGAWWLYCQRKDTRAFADYEENRKTNETLREQLKDTDPEIAEALIDLGPPKPIKRRWSMVAPCMIGLLVVWAVFFAEEPAYKTCEEIKADGMATITSDHARFNPDLDRNNDGIACND